MKINCSSPSIILHPLAVERIIKYGNYSIRGRWTDSPYTKKNLYYANTKELNPKFNQITEDIIDDCYITDTNTGNTYPLYLQVPCGHCENCKSVKVNNFVIRCELESQMYDCKPIFLTLTYDEKHKPKDGLCIRDIQLFFKRLRINLQRSGYRRNIRYCIVGEYGRNTKRPHYHALIWNLGQTDFVSYRQIGEILKKSWNLGFEMHRLCDPSDNKTFYYTAKYLRKDCDIPEGCNKPFISSSNRNGGIGAACIDALAYECLQKLNTTPKFKNKWSGAVKDLPISSYILNRMMPTLSKSLPSSVSKSLRLFNLCYKLLKTLNPYDTLGFDEQYIKYNELFSQFIFAPTDIDINNQFDMSPTQLLRTMLECELKIEKYYKRGLDYMRTSVYKAERREFFLSKLFQHAIEPTEDLIYHRAYKFRSSCARAAAREIL